MTKTSFFLLPLVGINTRFFGEKHFIDAYLHPDCTKVIVLLTGEFTEPALPFTFRAKFDLDYRSCYMFTIPDKFLPDVVRFLQGKYSKMSDHAKYQIRKYIKELNVNMEDEPTKEQLVYYNDQVFKSRHPLIYNIYAKSVYRIYPFEYAALYEAGTPLKELAKKAQEVKLGISLPGDMELLSIPKIDQELFKNI